MGSGGIVPLSNLRTSWRWRVSFTPQSLYHRGKSSLPIKLEAQQPLVGHGLLIIEATRSHSDTPHSVGLSGWVISRAQRPLPDNTQFSQETDVHDLGGIRTSNPSKRTPADPHLRTHDHWDRRIFCRWQKSLLILGTEPWLLGSPAHKLVYQLRYPASNKNCFTTQRKVSNLATKLQKTCSKVYTVHSIWHSAKDSHSEKVGKISVSSRRTAVLTELWICLSECLTTITAAAITPSFHFANYSSQVSHRISYDASRVDTPSYNNRTVTERINTKRTTLEPLPPKCAVPTAIIVSFCHISCYVL
jgi:hypothetical protein